MVATPPRGLSDVPETEIESELDPRGGRAEDSALSSRLSALLREIARLPEVESGSAWEPALRPGAVIGRFELVREVGRGGFGIVYEARDQELGRTVAFKAVRAGGSSAEVEERLLQEAEASARLSHPNIVTLFDVGRTENGPYLILEYLRGEALSRRLARGPVSVLEALRIAVEVAKGIAHAHAHGIVHRDLTPGNVFLCEDGQVKVLDLGLAHAFGRPRLEGGTPGYMAPEQRRGAPEDERTDVFALGVILYRLLANDMPFPRFAAAERTPPALEVSGAPALGPLIAHMLHRDPVERPRNAGEVLAALSAFLRELERTPSGAGLMAARTRRPLGLRVAAVAAALAAALAASIALWRKPAEKPASPEPDLSSIAVMPFADLSPEKDQEYFSDGLAEEILNALARVRGLRVPSRTSSFFFRGKAATLEEIGRELKVSAVLEGSVRKDGGRVRVTAQLVKVADGLRLWRETYERELTDVFAVQDEIARAVVFALDAQRSDGGAPAAEAPDAGVYATKDPEVYRQYLLGLHHARQFTTKSLRLAVEAYEKALALDPRYAPAWAGLAFPLYHLADRTSSPDLMKAQQRRALAVAERAVALSPDFADALSARGLLRAVIDLDWAGAYTDLRRALAVNGNDADSHRRYSTLLACSARMEEAVREARRAVDLDPLGDNWSKLGQLYQLAGELDLAEAAFRRDLQNQPNTVISLIGLGRNLLLQSNPTEALTHFERCADEDYRLWGRAVAKHSLRDEAASREALRKLVAGFAQTNAYDIASAHAWRGEKGPAFEWLERSFLQRDGALPAMLKTDPFLASLRKDPRYGALLQKLKLPND